jgi:hypothetical protein
MSSAGFYDSPFTTGANPSRPVKQPIVNNTFDAFLQPGQVSNMAKLEAAEKAVKQHKLKSKFKFKSAVKTAAAEGAVEAKAAVTGLVRHLTRK